MKKYTMTIAGKQRDLPICPLNENLQIGGFVIFGDPELTTACAEELLKIAPECDYFVAPEAKAIPLVHEMARLDGNRRYVLVRKANKLYMTNVFSVSVTSITTEKKQTLYMDGADADMIRGKRVLLIDDVISTGESLRALEYLVVQAGAEVVGRAAILAEGDAAKRKDIIYLEKLPLFDAEGNPIE